MSPERKGTNGEYRSSWQRRELGRIRVRYGKTLKAHRRAIAMLDELYDNDQLELIRAYKRRKVTMRDLLSAKKRRRHKRDDVLVDLRLQQPLWTTLEELAAKRGGEAHQKSRRSVLKRFARLVGGELGANAKVADLERLDWQALRESYSPGYWNHLRRAIGALLSELLGGPDHTFRKAIMGSIDRADEPEREVDISPDQFWRLVESLPDVAKAPIVTLAVTAMRLGEYYACGTDAKRRHTTSVYCPGSKNADASGIIPVADSLWHWVHAGIPAPISAQRLRHWFHEGAVATGLGRYEPTGKTKKVIERRARDGAPAKGERRGDRSIEVPATRYRGVTLHDLRHLALQLALDGGAQLNDVQSLARHADPAMTMRYLKRASRKRAAEAIARTLVPKSEEA